MAKFQRTILLALSLTTPISSFAPPTAGQKAVVVVVRSSLCRLSSTPAEGGEDEEPRLVLGNIESEMQSVRAGSNIEYDFGAIDFLANAKSRAAAQVESNNNGAGVDEWTNLAEEKKEQFGEIDDWENSVKEAGNTDSHILMFTDPPPEGEGGEGEDDEPKLLLF